MALKTVNWSVKGPDGSAKAGAQIVVKLSQAATLSGTSEVVPSTVILTTDSTGAASAQLQANNDLTPTGTFYGVTEQATDGGTFGYTMVVPQTAGPFSAASIMTGVAPTASPGVGHLSSLTVDAGLTVTAGPVSLPAASLSESNVANLTSDLASKANDAAVVHLAGAEAITGVKTFSANPVLNAGALPLSAVTGAAADSAVVHNTGAETVAGVKTFSSAPVVPANSFPESAVTNLVSDLAAKANDSAVVHLAGAETISGAKTFSGGLTVSAGAVTLPANSIADTALSANVDLLNAAQTITGAKTFSAQTTFGGGSYIDPSGNIVAAAGANLATVGQAATSGAFANSGFLEFISTYWNGSSSSGETFYARAARYGPQPGAAGQVRLAIGVSSNPDNNLFQIAGDGSNTVGIGFPFPNPSLGQLGITSASTTRPALGIRALAAQAADLQQWQKSDGTVLAKVDVNGGITASGLTVSGAAPTAAAGQVALGGTTATTATAGASGAPPAQVLGYLIANVAGTQVKVPFYAN